MSKSLYQLGVEIREEAAYMTGRQWQHVDGHLTGNPAVDDPAVKAVEDQARLVYGGIPELFARFELPHAGPTKASIATLRTVRDRLTSDSTPQGNSDPDKQPYNAHLDERNNQIGGDWTTSWHGLAKTNFVDNFASRVRPVASTQAALAEILAAALEQHEKIRGSAHHDIQQIGANTVAALKSLDPGDFRGGKGMSGNDLLTLTLTLAAVALAIPTDFASLGAWFGGLTLKSAMSFAVKQTGTARTIGETLPKDPETVAGVTVAEVISEMNDAISKLIRMIGVGNDSIAGQLAYLSSLLTTTDLEMPAPKDAAGADLAHENSDQLSHDFYLADT